MTNYSNVMKYAGHLLHTLCLLLFVAFCSQAWAQVQQGQVWSQGGGSSSGGQYQQFVVIGGEPVSSHVTGEGFSGRVGLLSWSNPPAVPTYAIGGNVLNPEGTAVTSGSVELLQRDGQNTLLIASVTLNQEGLFAFEQQPEGEYTLRVSPTVAPTDSLPLLVTYLGEARLPEQASWFMLQADTLFQGIKVLREVAPAEEWLGESTIGGILLQQKEGSSEGGRLLSGSQQVNGDPMVGAQVFLTNPQTREVIFSEVTNNEGRFNFANIAAREYGFMVEYEGKSVVMPESITVQTGGEVQLTAVVSEAGLDAVIEEVTGVEEEVAQTLLLYPNPAKSYLVVSFRNLSMQQTEIQLVDLKGKILLSKKIAGSTERINETLDIQSVTPGMYLLRISQQGLVINKKIVKY